MLRFSLFKVTSDCTLDATKKIKYYQCVMNYLDGLATHVALSRLLPLWLAPICANFWFPSPVRKRPPTASKRIIRSLISTCIPPSI